MTAKSRYWDHERCSWVNYEAAPTATSGEPELSSDALPEQRTDDETVPQRS